MTPVRTISTITALALLAAPAFSAGNEEHDSHHPAETAEQRAAQAPQPMPSMVMTGTMVAPTGYAEQLKAMQAMHDRMVGVRTPEEFSALMAEQWKLMQDGMAMMGRMGGGMGMATGMGSGTAMGGNRSGAMLAQPGDLASRQQMMEQRMDMLQSMMQMMMDRMMPAPARK